MTCLMPFLVIAVMNVFFDIMSLMQIITPFLLVSFLLQAVGAYLGYQVFKMVFPDGMQGMGGGMGGQPGDNGSNYQAYNQPLNQSPQTQSMSMGGGGGNAREMSPAGGSAGS